MALAFIKRTFGLKKANEDKNYDDFLKNFNNAASVYSGHMQKVFKKHSFRLIIINNTEHPVIYDSSSGREQKHMPVFKIGDDKVTLHDIAFGACPLKDEYDVLSSMKVHEFQHQILITRLFRPPSRRCNTKAQLSQSAFGRSHMKARSFNTADKSLAICLILNLEFISNGIKPHNQSRSPPKSDSLTRLTTQQDVPTTTATDATFPTSSSVPSSTFAPPSSVARHPSPKPSLQFFTNGFYNMLFEHNIQFGILVEKLVDDAAFILKQAPPVHLHLSAMRNGEAFARSPSAGTHMHSTEIPDRIFQKFTEFQQGIRDLLCPRLTKPVWAALQLALAAEPDEIEASSSPSDVINGVKYWLSQTPSHMASCATEFCGSPFTQHDILAQAFVRGCLCAQISKSFSKDRGFFLGQLITGILMYHPGWISTVLPKESNMCATPYPRTPNICEGLKNRTASASHTFLSYESDPTPNLLLEQSLMQCGCTFSRHVCENAPLLNNHGNVFSCTVLFGLQRERLLILLYIATYFLRAPSLLQSRERLPDLGRADLFELNQHRRRIRHQNKNRRKSNSLANAHGGSSSMNRGYAGNDPHDSGISSQEDLTTYSASAGSSPTHPPNMAVCLTQRLTQDQCRVAEAAAQFVVQQETTAQFGVKREVAAAAHFAGGTRQLHAVANPGCQIPDISALNAVAMGIPRGHTWTVSTNRTISAFINMFGGIGNTTNAPMGTAPPAQSANGRGPHFTEIPLLLEKSFDNTEEVCCCIGGLSTSTATWPAAPSSGNSSGSSSHRGIAIGKQAGSSSGFVDCAHQRTSSLETASGSRSVAMHITMEAPAQETMAFPVGHQDPAGAQTPDIELTYHCQVGAGVLDHFTTGLALEATVESLDSFRPKLESELLSWLLYAPGLLHPPTTNETTAERYADSPSSSNSQIHEQQGTAFTTSALLVNTDANTVEVLSLELKRDKSNPSPLDSPSCVDLPSQRRVSVSSQTSHSTFSGVLQRHLRGRHSATSPRSSFSFDTCTPVDSGGVVTSTRVLEPAPTVIRLLETIKQVVDCAGCPSLALQYLESHLQQLYCKGQVLADLLECEGVGVLSQPDRMAIAVGCARGDLPLLLSIAHNTSCRAATVLHCSDIDWRFPK